jgi:MFS family permease
MGSAAGEDEPGASETAGLNPQADGRRGLGGSRFGALLARPQVRWLLASSILARLPRGLVSLALLLLVRERYGSLAGAGFTVGAFALSNAASTPLQGGLVDRFGQRRVLLPSGLAHAALLVAIVLAARAHLTLETVAALAVLAGISCPPVAACTRAMWWDVVTDARGRDAIFALDSTATELVWTTGPLIVGVIVAVSAPQFAVLAAALATAVGVTIYTALPATRSWRSRERRTSRLGALGSGGLRALLVSVVLSGACWGAVSVGLPAIAVRHGAPSLSGLLLALFSLGSLIGGLSYGTRSWGLATGTRYRLLLMLMVATTAPLVASGDSLVATAFVSLVAGLSWAPAMGCQYALTSSLALPGTATEAFGWTNSAFGLGMSLGTSGGGAVASLGIGAPFAFACVLAALAATVAISRRARIDAPPAVRAPALGGSTDGAVLPQPLAGRLAP